MENKQGLSVEYKILPGSIIEITLFKDHNFDLSKNFTIFSGL